MINERNAKYICCEDISHIENYQEAMNDSVNTWHCHHRLGIQGDVGVSRDELISKGQYFGVPASQLIFLTEHDHLSLHAGVRNKGNKFFLGHHWSDEQKKAIGDRNRGKQSAFLGKHHTDEAKKKMSDAHRGKTISDEHKKRISEWSSEHKKGNTNVRGKKWWNNGIINKRAFECPGEGFVQGRGRVRF